MTEGGKGKTKVAAGYGQTAVKRSYGYDRTGNLTHSADQRTGTTQFEYDRLGRITKAGSELFAFDPAHNILDIPTEKVKPYPAPSPVGEGRGEGKTAALLSANSNAITDNRLKTDNGTTYYYDNFGNLIHRELADGEVQNYFYDLHDQLVKAEIFKKDGTKETWAYSYDALGRRIGKGRLKDGEVSDGLEEETGFVWDGSHLLQEVHSDSRYTYIYTDPGSYEPLAQVRDWTTEDGESRQQTHYFHCDQIGIPREMTDKDGNLLWFGNYTGWGRLKEETRVTDTAYQPFRLQNQYADRETGLHYNFLRYYEPECGRFIRQDPIRLEGGTNLYSFASNVQSWIDPLGLFAFAIPLIIEAGAIIKGLLFVGSAAAVGYAGSKAIQAAQSQSQTKTQAIAKPVPPAIAQSKAGKKGCGKCTRADNSIAGAGAGAPMPPDDDPDVEQDNRKQKKGSRNSDSSKNEKHGDGGRSLKAAEKRIKELQEQIKPGMPKKERLSLEKKINNITKTAARKAKGVEHSRGAKR